VLRQLLNRDGMNKLSQLSVSVSFTLWVTCLDRFSYMLPKFLVRQILKWFYDTFTGAATGAVRCGSFEGKDFSLSIISYG
jgi:hypothetical protein